MRNRISNETVKKKKKKKNDTLRLNTVQFEIQSIDSYLSNNDLHQVYALITFGTSKISLFFLELLEFFMWMLY